MNGKQYQIQNGSLVDITPKIAALNGGRQYTGLAPIVVDNVNDTIALAEAVVPLRDAIYVATTGSDTNDGKTAATAVKTIGKALEIAEGMLFHNEESAACIRIATGTYSEDVVVRSRVLFQLSGNVTISSFLAGRAGYARFVSDSSTERTLTVNGSVISRYDSVVLVESSVALSIVGSLFAELSGSIFVQGALSVVLSGGNRIRAFKASLLIISGPSFTVSGSSTGSVIDAHDGSEIYVTSTSVNISGTFPLIFDSEIQSYLFVGSSDSSVATSVVISGAISNRLAFCNVTAALLFGVAQITFTSTVALSTIMYASFGGSIICLGATMSCTAPTVSEVLSCGQNSSMFIGDGASFTANISNSITGNGIIADQNSNIAIYAAIHLVLPSCNNFIFSRDGAMLSIYGDSIVLDGAARDSVFYSQVSGVIAVSTAATLSGTATGRRYACNIAGVIDVAGAGPNRLPGTIAGYADASSFGLYV